MLKNILFVLLILLLLRWFFPEISETLHHIVDVLVTMIAHLLDGFTKTLH